MAYRLTNTEKWGDSWFCSLKPTEKLLFMYLCDNCNLAGFVEYIPKRWALDIGVDKKGIEEGLKGIQRGIAWSKEEDCVYICNFLKHQKNYPFNEKNLAHQSIIKIFGNYSDKFDIHNITEFVEGGYKGLSTPSGNSNSICNIKGDNNSDINKEKFEKFRLAYKGTKRGLDTEYENFIKKNDVKIVNLLFPALEKEIAHRQRMIDSKQWCADWKDLQTWINKKCWEQEFPEPPKSELRWNDPHSTLKQEFKEI